MNKQRRAELGRLDTRLEELRADLETIKDDEQSAFDQMPESLQNGERGQKAENVVSFLDDALSSLDDARMSIESAAE